MTVIIPNIRRILGVAGLVALALASSSALRAQEATEEAVDEVVATLNGDPIRESDLALAAQDYGDNLAQIPEEEQRTTLIDTVVDMRLMAAAAVEVGLDQDPAFQEQMEQLRQRELRNMYFAEVIDAMITDEEVRARYDEEVALLDLPEEIRASHILVETEEEANEIIQLLDEGGDFATLAMERSLDTGSGAEGGDLGYFTAGDMVEQFEDAAFALETGTYSQTPVESDFGWHVILVVDRRQQEPPDFESVASQVRLLLQQEAYLEAVSALREGADIQVIEPEPAEEAPAADGAADTAPEDAAPVPEGEAPAEEPAPAE